MRLDLVLVFAGLTAPGWNDASATPPAICPPAARIQGDNELATRARSLVSPAIRLAGRDELPAGCPLTDAWLTATERGVTLVLESPWGVEARAVQSVELAVALLESWSVDAPVSSSPESETRASVRVLEPGAREPPPIRRLSVSAQLELSNASGRSWSTGGSASVGPIFFDTLRPFLSMRGASGFGFPDYYTPTVGGGRALLTRSAGEFELLVGTELDLRFAARLTWSLGAAGGFAWMSVQQDSIVPTGGRDARSFLDARFEGRTALGYALDDQWSVELSLCLAPVRDLSRVLLPALATPFEYEGVLPLLRAGLGVRWAFGTPREAAERSRDDG